MNAGRTFLYEGARVLTETGAELVVRFDPTGVDLRDCLNNIRHRDWNDLPLVQNIVDGRPVAVARTLRPLWDSLDDKARERALNKLEIVLEIVTGYRDGHPELRRPGEPYPPFGPGFGVSESKRAVAMASVLIQEGRNDRKVQRRLRDGELTSVGTNESTIRNWVRSWRQKGLLGLIDGRHIRKSLSWEVIDPRYRAIAEEEFATLDGDRSNLAIQEMHRRVLVKLRNAGIDDYHAPQRTTQKFLSNLKHQRGETTRSQRTKKLQTASGSTQYPGVRPGQVVAIDVTRADNLVYDTFNGRPLSVEIITAIDVATRVVLALRVVPMSANGFEAGLLLYDVCRPFSMLVAGTTVSDWRWVGLPKTVDLSSAVGRVWRQDLEVDFDTLQGRHPIPSVMPDAIHCDNAAIFTSVHFRALLRDLQIDLLLSRPGNPTDNPQVERWHETIQRGLQQIPGYKGRNVSERGRLVADEPLLTARELQLHLRKFIALDYHRHGHDGLIQPGAEAAKMCPLDLWDVMVEATGRIDVPQRHDLIYQFLPIKWGTIGPAGVEFSNLRYENPLVFEPLRYVEVGRFREKDRAAPFFYDPNDLSRIWFHDESTDRIEPIEWVGRSKVDAPMTDVILDELCRKIRRRGGNHVFKRGLTTQLIINELGELTSARSKADRRKTAAAAQRVEQSRIDHAEAEAAQERANPVRSIAPRTLPTSSIRRAWDNLLETE
ncbi:DDE-type integrase/transposase/recombinase [Mycobacterium barrassiae]|nr:DDE-type integrase/transposase/recombinase [Mycobacterium barrassiae]UUO02072.1 integrase [Mycolicibacterium novocastrense]